MLNIILEGLINDIVKNLNSFSVPTRNKLNLHPSSLLFRMSSLPHQMHRELFLDKVSIGCPFWMQKGRQTRLIHSIIVSEFFLAFGCTV